MEIKSAAFPDRGEIPSKYTCDGDNVSPPLQFGRAPGGTKAFAILVDDPDAPNGTFLHWLVWNLPDTTTGIDEGAGRGGGRLPAGAVQGRNDFGAIGWGGPCPPDGRHRYEFHLYALAQPIELGEGAGRAEFERALSGNILEVVSFSATYARHVTA